MTQLAVSVKNLVEWRRALDRRLCALGERCCVARSRHHLERARMRPAR